MTARVALLGYSHEVNSLAAVSRLASAFEARRHPGGLRGSWECGAFVRRLTELREVEFVELPVWEIPPGGPMLHEDFESFVVEIDSGLRSAGPIDGVAVFGHGAGTTTSLADADGEYLMRVRDVVGPDVPIVAVLDFHANISAAMLRSTDVCVGYLTNPHIDIGDRLAEMAEHLHRLLDGERFRRTWIRIPLIAAQIGLLTSDDEPMGRVISDANRWRNPAHVNVSVFGGFSLSDTPDCGMSVVVTTRPSNHDEGVGLAKRVAARLWSLRSEFRFRTTPVADAVERCRSHGDRRFILADVADNPGGGGSGSTLHLLEAFLGAGIPGVQIGVLRDPGVVADAHHAGVGGTITTTFNRETDDPFAHRRSMTGRVVAIGGGAFVPTGGMMAGATLDVGRTCCLDIDGVMVGVSERPFQVTDPDVMRNAGLRPEDARVVVVKSRGHFRAGFTGVFDDHEVVEVGAPGLATNDLESVEWRRIVRPVYPLDPDLEWSPDSCVVFG